MNKTFEGLSHELTQLHFRWMVFRNVYAVDQKHIEILNDLDGCFFGTVQGIFWDTIILDISKLIDPMKTGNNHNLSIHRLWHDYREFLSSSVNEELEIIILEIRETNKKLKNHRSKRLAHLDYQYGTNKEAYNLGGISRADIEVILQLLREFLNKIQSEIDNTTTMYDGIIGVDGGKELFRKLKLLES